MKVLLATIITGLLGGLQCFAGYANNAGVTATSPMRNDMTGSGEYTRQQVVYAQAEAKSQFDQVMQQELVKIYSKDTWRKIGNETNLARGSGWVEFQGRVQSSSSDGVVFRGKYGPILTIWIDPYYCQNLLRDLTLKSLENRGIGMPSYYLGSNRIPITSASFGGDDLFLVSDFPYPAVRLDLFKEMMAFDAGYISYTNNDGQILTIHKLIYGTPCEKTWTTNEIATAKAKIIGDKEAKKKLESEKILKNNQDLADKGDPYGLCRMGERYRDGDGVVRDLTKAKAYFQRAVAAGSDTATKELRWLPDDAKTNSVAANQ